MSKCKNCGKEFDLIAKIQVFCSKICRVKYYIEDRKKENMCYQYKSSVDELSQISAKLFKGEQ